MTTQQQNTVNQIENLISRMNSNITFGTLNLRKGHIVMTAIRKRTNAVADITEIFCDIDINTKGNIVKGKWNKLQPIEKTTDYFHL